MICTKNIHSFNSEFARKLREGKTPTWWGLGKLLFIGTKSEFEKFKEGRVKKMEVLKISPVC